MLPRTRLGAPWLILPSRGPLPEAGRGLKAADDGCHACPPAHFMPLYTKP